MKYRNVSCARDGQLASFDQKTMSRMILRSQDARLEKKRLEEEKKAAKKERDRLKKEQL